MVVFLIFELGYRLIVNIQFSRQLNCKNKAIQDSGKKVSTNMNCSIFCRCINQLKFISNKQSENDASEQKSHNLCYD